MDAPITRAEFASLINQAEQANGDAATAASQFTDIEASFWGAQGIAGANAVGFMSGYSTPQGLVFRPEEQIPRWQVFVTLASGLELAPPADVDGFLSGYDLTGVPNWARAQVAATINAGLAINADRSKGLEGNRPTTRGEATAMLQQVLQRQNKVQEKVDASPFVIKK
ncbi:MAG: S-layer homology domain-containing protein [Synechococcales cyanobacterium RM1_1_8]|nr:S-layer homology domain-containing protein [Synechococcales cyanobacterium RM1_1_8]